MKKIRNSKLILDVTQKPSYKHRIRVLFRKLKSILYKIRLNRIKINSGERKRYNVTICAIFKNEAPYLREWIEFNRVVGIEHFYLFNNNSDDEYMPILQPYISEGLVTLEQWPKNQAQMECYNFCIDKYKSEAQWIGFIDIDEFIVPIEYNNIYDFLKLFENNRGSVKLYWKMFGSAGLMDRNLKSLVTEDFTVAWPLYYSVGKCFYNTSFDFDFNDENNRCLHHMFWANYHGKRIPPVNVFDKVCLDEVDLVKEGTHPIQINHYFTKSYKEYAMKKSKGDVYFNINPHDEEYFYLHEMENTAVDFSAYKYLIKLKLAMAKSGQSN